MMQMSPRNQRLSISQQAIQNAAIAWGVSPAEILAKGRGHTSVSRARQQAYLEMWANGMSLVQIAYIMGRDHTTVLYGARRAAMRMMLGEAA